MSGGAVPTSFLDEINDLMGESSSQGIIPTPPGMSCRLFDYQRFGLAGVSLDAGAAAVGQMGAPSSTPVTVPSLLRQAAENAGSEPSIWLSALPSKALRPDERNILYDTLVL